MTILIIKKLIIIIQKIKLFKDIFYNIKNGMRILQKNI